MFEMQLFGLPIALGDVFLLNAAGGPLLDSTSGKLQSCLNIDYDPAAATPSDCTLRLYPQPNTRTGKWFEIDFERNDVSLTAVSGGDPAQPARLNIQPFQAGGAGGHTVHVFDHLTDPDNDGGTFIVFGAATIKHDVILGIDTNVGGANLSVYLNSEFRGTVTMEEPTPAGNQWTIPNAKNATDHRLLGVEGNDGAWYEIIGTAPITATPASGSITIALDTSSQPTQNVVTNIRLDASAGGPTLQVLFAKLTVSATEDATEGGGTGTWQDVAGWATTECEVV